METKTLPTVDFKAVIKKLGWTPIDEEYKQTTYVDQDGHAHVVLDSKKLDIKQLDRLYNNTFSSGNMCGVRSESYRKKLKNENWGEGVDIMTIASILQFLCFGLNDMGLMSKVTMWLDYPHFRF